MWTLVFLLSVLSGAGSPHDTRNFYRADGTWASDDDTSQDTGGTWRIEGNRFFQNDRVLPPSPGETIILLTDADFVYGTNPYYLRLGTAFPWRY